MKKKTIVINFERHRVIAIYSRIKRCACCLRNKSRFLTGRDHNRTGSDNFRLQCEHQTSQTHATRSTMHDQKSWRSNKFGAVTLILGCSATPFYDFPATLAQVYGNVILYSSEPRAIPLEGELFLVPCELSDAGSLRPPLYCTTFETTTFDPRSILQAPPLLLFARPEKSGLKNLRRKISRLIIKS